MNTKKTPGWWYLVTLILFVAAMGTGCKSFWGKVLIDRTYETISVGLFLLLIIWISVGIHKYGPKYKKR